MTLAETKDALKVPPIGGYGRETDLSASQLTGKEWLEWQSHTVSVFFSLGRQQRFLVAGMLVFLRAWCMRWKWRMR